MRRLRKNWPRGITRGQNCFSFMKSDHNILREAGVACTIGAQAPLYGDDLGH